MNEAVGENIIFIECFHTLIFSDKKHPMEIQNYYKYKVGTSTLEKTYKNVNIKLDIDPINML